MHLITLIECSTFASTTVQVTGLPVPGALVEIEVVAARRP